MPGPGEQSPIDEQEQARSQAEVERGGIPLAAQRRLTELREGSAAFTSDLSVADFALCHQLGLKPLSQVMGTSIYQIGYQPTGWGMMRELGELEVISQAWNETRERAFSRLAQEAMALGASAVVGVEVRSGMANWTEVAGGAIEYVVSGTAVRREREGDRAHGQGPVLTELSVADYAKLLAAGVEPAGIVAWTSVFFISLIYFQAEREERGLGSSMLGGGLLSGGAFQNFEYRGATQGFYGARETVMERLNYQAQQLGASGIVGVRIGHTVRGTQGGSGSGGAGLIASFSALGTAVHDRDMQPPKPPLVAIDLTT